MFRTFAWGSGMTRCSRQPFVSVLRLGVPSLLASLFVATIQRRQSRGDPLLLYYNRPLAHHKLLRRRTNWTQPSILLLTTSDRQTVTNRNAISKNSPPEVAPS